ncbi:MAG: hypothetical protein ACYS6K_26890, partial [Planctomycetota bacterium]
MSFNSQLQQKAQFVDDLLRRLMASRQIEDRLKEALTYTLSAPGKRLRSVLVLWCCELVGDQTNHNAEI